MYCRFCTRRRKVGDPEKIPLNQYDSAFAYIASHPEIRDVILSGGETTVTVRGSGGRGGRFLSA